MGKHVSYFYCRIPKENKKIVVWRRSSLYNTSILLTKTQQLIFRSSTFKKNKHIHV